MHNLKKRKKENKILQPPINKNLLREITRRLIRRIKPEKIILFGSYACGKPDKNSDLDLFIIKKTRIPPSRRFGLISDALYPRTIPMDFVVRTPQEVKNRLKGFDPFLKEILSHGKILYEAK